MTGHLLSIVYLTYGSGVLELAVHPNVIFFLLLFSIIMLLVVGLVFLAKL